MKQLRFSQETCGSCLAHQELVDWSLATEECIQPRLQQLAIQWSAKVSPLTKPDPQHCILYEREALEELKNCYQKNISPVCDILTDELNQEFVNDLGKLASSFAVSDYYRPIIHDHLRELLQECPASSAIETVAQAIPQPKEKLLFCAAVSGNNDSNSVNIKLEVISHLNDRFVVNAEDFVYADISNSSTTRNDFCQKTSPTEANGGLMEGYRLIQWTPTELPSKLKNFYKKGLSSTSSLLFFHYSPATSSCGNGFREAGELCDTFGDIGNDEYGCDATCTPFANYECSTDQLAISNCASSYCGNGLRSSSEECDDGNTIDNDGCSSSCTIESSAECTQLSYNVTSLCALVSKKESSSILPTVITPTSAAQSSSTTSSVAMTTTTTRPIVEPSVFSEPTNEPFLHSSGHRASSLSWWVLILLILSLALIR